MIIDVTPERDGTHFKNTHSANFPYQLSFLDRTTGVIVNANLDSETLINMVEEIKQWGN